MREPARDKGRLEHIMSSIDLLLDSAMIYSVEELSTDCLRYYGIVKNIEIIGEAANLLSPEFKTAHPEIEWKKIVAMRNVLVHDYYNILPSEIWNVLHNDIPRLKSQLKAIL